MPFVSEILNYNSLSIIGMEKNTGKTECLNYVLRNIPMQGRKIAVSSIGIDGESTDQVTKTAKPEIVLREGMYFATSEKHYRSRRLLSELIDISDESTSLGRIVTAKALTQGKILLSGPASTTGLRRWMNEMKKKGIDLIIVDGALSRKSLASPAVSESMILATGAACSININTLVQKTAFAVEMINLSLATSSYLTSFSPLIKSTWVIDDDDHLIDMLMSSSLNTKIDTSNLKHCKAIFVSGALTDGFMTSVRQEKKFSNVEVVVRDFTKIFISPEVYKSFIRSGRKVTVLQRSKLLAVTVNPTSPNGYVIDSDKLCASLSEAIHLPVYDIVKNNYAI